MRLVAAEVAVALLLAVGLRRYRALVALGFLLFGVALVQPGPPDVVFAVAIAVGLLTRRANLLTLPTPVTALLGAFVLLNLIAVTASDRGRSRALLFMAITVYLIAFAAWLACYVQNRSRADLVMRWYLVGALPVAALSVMAIFVTFPGSSYLVDASGMRAKGLFQDQNVFGPFLVPVVMILLERVTAPGLSTARRTATWAGLVVALSGVLFSSSRGAWLNAATGLAIMLVVLLTGRGRGRRAVVMLGVVAPLAAVELALVHVPAVASFLTQRSHLQTYDSNRLAAQELGVTLGASHPLTGVGPGNFEAYSTISAHSLFVRTLAEEGVPGFAVLMLLLVLTLGMAVHHVLAGKDTYGIGAGPLLASWCGLLVNSLVVDTLHWRHLWFVAALIWAPAVVRALPSAAHPTGAPEHVEPSRPPVLGTSRRRS